MTSKLTPCTFMAILVIATAITTAHGVATDELLIPANRDALNSWWGQLLRPAAQRGPTLDPVLVAAEQGATVVTVRKDGTGNFKTVTDAVNSVPVGNTRRVVINIGPGEYHEKVTVDAGRRFVTMYGSPDAMPVLTFGGTALQYGTVDSATLMALADYFVGANLIIKNSAPRPDGKRKGAQATALRVSGNKSAFYNCRLIGFQDTLCDDRGNHLFKDCYVEGTVDFIFGSGTSLYLNTELHVIGSTGMSAISAQARQSESENTGYVFVHCNITGTGGQAFLGRAWQSRPRVVYAYSTLSDAISSLGWSDNFHPDRDKTVFYGEYMNDGVGANRAGRAVFSKELTLDQVRPFITLGFIQGSSWLLPLPKL